MKREKTDECRMAIEERRIKRLLSFSILDISNDFDLAKTCVIFAAIDDAIVYFQLDLLCATNFSKLVFKAMTTPW